MALHAGIGYVLMMATPFAEFYALPKLLIAVMEQPQFKALVEQR
jgi:hypothetical protein